MEDGSNESEFMPKNAKDEFLAKAGNIFSAFDNVQYVPTGDSDGFLKIDPVKDRNDEKPKSRHHLDRRASRSHGIRPSMPPPQHQRRRKRYIQPGYVRDPKCYTKYTLSDVPDDQLTQQSNTHAALKFLKEIDDRKAKDDEEPPLKDGKIVFKKPNSRDKPKTSKQKSQIGNESPSGGTSQQTPNNSEAQGSSSVVLSHLEYEDE